VKADRARAKGQPLVLLGVVLATWISGRIALWESPFARAVPVLAAPMTALPASGEAPPVVTAAAAPARPGGVMTKVPPRCARCAVAVPNLGESFPFAAPAPAVNGLLPPPRLGDRRQVGLRHHLEAVAEEIEADLRGPVGRLVGEGELSFEHRSAPYPTAAPQVGGVARTDLGYPFDIHADDRRTS